MAVLCLAAAAASPIRPGAPGPHTGTVQSSQLYTPPDATAGGGIRGRIVASGRSLLGVFAMPQDDWKKVYLGQLGPDGAFAFSGLPAARYDLAVLLDDRFCEGIVLHRQPDTLTDADRRSIQAKLEASNAFFNEKRIHRLEGTTGRAGQARALLQEARTRPVTLQSAEVRADIQIRSLKVARLEDVGPGWSLEDTRELARQEVGPSDVKGMLPVTHLPRLSGVRVVENVKEIGDIGLAP
jgi:hypothetical protein